MAVRRVSSLCRCALEVSQNPRTRSATAGWSHARFESCSNVSASLTSRVTISAMWWCNLFGDVISWPLTIACRSHYLKCGNRPFETFIIFEDDEVRSGSQAVIPRPHRDVCSWGKSRRFPPKCRHRILNVGLPGVPCGTRVRAGAAGASTLPQWPPTFATDTPWAVGAYCDARPGTSMAQGYGDCRPIPVGIMPPP